ncbi:MAG TPA: phage major capsid protein [Xanthobacteraceae bacterium]|nr:phage major capsid protein [Xanthobacteraceae bacterium]
MELEIHDSLQTKSVAAPETKAIHDDMQRLFEEFKAANDERLAAHQRSTDVLIEEKLARLDDEMNRRFDQISLKASRPALAVESKSASALSQREHKSAFVNYMRTGETAGLRQLEVKALSAGSNPDGGYTVPVEIEIQIGQRLTAISPIRGIAGVRTISGNVYKKPFMTAGPAVGWVGETDARTQTTSPTLDALSFPAMELYAMPAATATLLEDSAVNIDQWLASEVEQAFAVQEGTAFVTGDGSNKPKGFLEYATIDNASWEWGKIGYVASGAAGAFAASNPSDTLVDLIYALKAGYRQNGTFVMNRKTQSVVRKFKDSTGAYLWQPPAQALGRATLMTFPVVEAEDMPDIAANSYSVAFGDFSRGYLIVDRAGVNVLRDPFSAKPYVLFYTTKRVGGGVQDFDAIKLIKFAAS